MLDDVCAYLKNYFETDKYFGEIKIESGSLVGFEDKLQNGQYFRIVGSVFNDGVYQYPTNKLTNETFTDGAVWALAIPSALVSLSNDIDTWLGKYGGADSEALSPFTSESFGGYSYSKSAGGSADGSGASGSWQSVYAARLARWKKI